MVNHPNRKKIFGLAATEHPTAEQIRALRDALSMTQEEAAKFVHVSTRTWQAWELGQNPMHIATWEHWHLKVLSLRPKTADPS
jgi:DNA-binding transcriptional regulator YiaG